MHTYNTEQRIALHSLKNVKFSKKLLHTIHINHTRNSHTHIHTLFTRKSFNKNRRTLARTAGRTKTKKAASGCSNRWPKTIIKITKKRRALAQTAAEEITKQRRAPAQTAGRKNPTTKTR